MRGDDALRAPAYGPTPQTSFDPIPYTLYPPPTNLHSPPSTRHPPPRPGPPQVLWGRAYLCELVLGERPGPTQLFYLRGPDDDEAVAMDPHGVESETASGTNREWVRKEGHMACVWRLAERVARAAAVDQMRVDIFVAKGDPNGCMVNENSLSSGSDTWPHRMYLARLWAEGHERHLYTTFGNASSPISYMTTEADIPTF